MKKGLLITQDITADGGGFTLNQSLSPQKLRQYTLYWDEIACPQSNIFHFGMGHDFEFLMDAGVARYEQVNFFGAVSGNAQYWNELQERAFLQLTKSNSAAWSLASEVKSLHSTHLGQNQNSTLCMHLLDSIRVFTEDVPLAEILEFKQRRHDELIEFRDGMDELLERTLFFADSAEAVERQIRKVQRDLNEVNRIMTESKYPSVATCATNALTVDGAFGMLAPFVTPTLIALGLPVEPQVRLIAAVSSGIAFSLFKGRNTQVLPRELKQYAYIAHAKQELR